MKRMQNILSLAAGLALISSGPQLRAENPNTREASSHKKGTDHQPTLNEAIQSNQLMIQAGKLAQEKATHPAVRKLGAALAEDHQKLQEKLQSLAKKENVKTNPSLDGEQEQQLKQIKSMAGPDIDEIYLQVVIADHQRELTMIQNESQPGAFGRFLSDHASMIKRHLEMAQAAQEQLKVALNDPNGAYPNSVRNVPRTTPADEAVWSPADDDIEFKKGDGEVLGLPTSKSDGTILGVLPAPSHTVRAGSNERYIAEELADGKVDAGVESVQDADRKAVGAPPRSERAQGAERNARGNQIPDAVQNTLKQKGWKPGESKVHRVRVFQADLNGKKVYVTENGKILNSSGE